MKEWTEYVKSAVNDLGGPQKCKPSSGMPIALAGMRWMRDYYVDAMSANGKPIKECQAAVEHINDAHKALWAKIKKEGVKEGFLSNASAAAKAAGYGGEKEEMIDVEG